MRWQPFDRSRHVWWPSGAGTPDLVVGADGRPRPGLRLPVDTFVVHYVGAGTSWLDPGDTAAELAGIEVNHARPSGKPNEYNSASDSEGVTWEWAGRWRAAHTAGWNSLAWGHLAVIGVEQPDPAQVDGLVAGVRRARAQLVAAGWLTGGHRVVGHSDLGVTGCPGVLRTDPLIWSRIVADLDDDPAEGERMRWVGQQEGRWLDTRQSGGPLAVGVRRKLDRHPSVPRGATHVMVRVTSVTDSTTLGGWVAAWGGGPPSQVTAVHNWPARCTGGIGSTSVVELDVSGGIAVQASAGCHLVVDLLGWQ